MLSLERSEETGEEEEEDGEREKILVDTTDVHLQTVTIMHTKAGHFDLTCPCISLSLSLSFFHD